MPAPDQPRRWVIAGLILLVVAVYWPASEFDFVRWDDPVNVTENQLITEPWSWPLVTKLLNGDTALRFKPLTWLIYRGMHAGFGFHPAAWHGLSLLLHLGAVLLFRAVLRLLLARFRPQTPLVGLEVAALLGAAAWAVHPARAEPACWVTATPYPLIAICLLGSFWFYSQAMNAAAGPARRRDWVLSWLLALLGYTAYPVGVTYGLWLVAADLWIFRVAPNPRDGLRAMGPWLARHAAFFLPAIASMAVTWASSSTTPWLYPAPPSLAQVDLLMRLKMSAAMLTSIWSHLVWPFGLTPNNPMLTAERSGAPFLLLLAAGAILLLGAVWLLRVRRPALAGAVLGSTLLALPVLGPAQWPSWTVADRHVYLPHLVLTAVLVIWLVPRSPDSRRRRLLALGGFMLVALLAVLGRRQVMIWRNTDTLFTYIEAQPAFAWNAHQQAYVYLLWGAHAQEHGHREEAANRFNQARQALQAGLLAAAERGALDEAVDLSAHLEQTFGLPPVLRRERVRWLQTLQRPREAEADLLQLSRETAPATIPEPSGSKPR